MSVKGTDRLVQTDRMCATGKCIGMALEGMAEKEQGLHSGTRARMCVRQESMPHWLWQAGGGIRGGGGEAMHSNLASMSARWCEIFLLAREWGEQEGPRTGQTPAIWRLVSLR